MNFKDLECINRTLVLICCPADTRTYSSITITLSIIIETIRGLIE